MCHATHWDPCKTRISNFRTFTMFVLWAVGNQGVYELDPFSRRGIQTSVYRIISGGSNTCTVMVTDEYGTDMLSRNVCTDLPLDAA
jgi:hypothetical protein